MAEKKSKYPLKTVYYADPLKDEFSSAKIDPIVIDEKYRYRRNVFLSRFLYHCAAKPLALGFLFLKYRHRVIGREKLPEGKYYLYGNHTNAGADAVLPGVLARPRFMKVIVHPANVSMPVLGKITPYIGALPLPDTREATRAFLEALEGDEPVTIYPEAHIWPYYTGIRPFPNASFRYPVKENVPSFCFTNTYSLRRGKICMTTYVDGPFYGKGETFFERRSSLRDQIYSTMKERANNNTVEVIRYEKKS